MKNLRVASEDIRGDSEMPHTANHPDTWRTLGGRVSRAMGGLYLRGVYVIYKCNKYPVRFLREDPHPPEST